MSLFSFFVFFFFFKLDVEIERVEKKTRRLLALPTTTTTMTTINATTQTIVFLRHGVAEHNVRGANLASPSLWDPSLTLEGKVSAVRAGETIKQWWKQQQQQQPMQEQPMQEQQEQQQPPTNDSHGSDRKNKNNAIELIICSPLSRTLQTATLAFVPDPPYATSSSSATPSLVCVEAVREAFGMHYPDKRRNRSVLMVSRWLNQGVNRRYRFQMFVPWTAAR